MVAMKPRKNSNKNPPILSHEFVIQNHADIVACIAMVFLIGLMIQVTSPWAYTFIVIHHNVSSDNPMLPQKYTTGLKDCCVIFFYFLMTIVMHAVLQEHILDKLSKRLHLSKVKISKFNESSQLLVFYLISLIWASDIIVRDEILSNLNTLWLNYPSPMSFSLKLFFIAQLAYWLHCYPELYFQRAKKEEIPSRVVHATIGLLFTFASYIFNYQRITVLLLAVHYIADMLQHGSRLMHFVQRKENLTKISFTISNTVYVISRITTLILSAVVFLYGLNQIEQKLDYTTGNYNIPMIRYSAFALISVFQIHLFYVFVRKQLQRSRLENASPTVTKIKSKGKLRKKDNKKSTLSEDDELPEVDQATKKNLRSRSSVKTK